MAEFLDSSVRLLIFDFLIKYNEKNITDIIIVALKNSLNEIIGYLVLKYINDNHYSFVEGKKIYDKTLDK